MTAISLFSSLRFSRLRLFPDNFHRETSETSGAFTLASRARSHNIDAFIVGVAPQRPYTVVSASDYLLGSIGKVVI